MISKFFGRCNSAIKEGLKVKMVRAQIKSTCRNILTSAFLVTPQGLEPWTY
jgi:hypothetical protein